MAEREPGDELVAELRAVLARADVDTSDLVETAWEQAREDVTRLLRRLMVEDLLGRATADLAGGPGRTVPESDPAVSVPDEPVAYLLGVVPAGTVLPAGLATLPDGSAIETIAHGDLAALVSRMSASRVALLEDPDPSSIDELARLARAHDEVLAAVARETVVLPLRLGTVVADTDAVVSTLRTHAEHLRAELDRLDGAEEWTVQVPADVAPAGDADADRSTGTAFLEGLGARLGQREDRRRDTHALATRVHDVLRAASDDAERVRSRRGDGDPPLALHGVYLVSRSRRQAFDRAVADVEAELGRPVVVTGPWPPYHFTEVRLGATEVGS